MTPAATATEAAVLLDEPAVDERALVDDVTVDAPPRLVLVPDTEDEPAGFDFELALQDASVRMRRYAVRRLYHDADADEIVQEAMLRALQHRSRFASADDLHAWLTVVTGHLVIDRIRLRGKATPVAELPSGSRVARDTADVVVARQEARVALDALEAMPTRQAAVLWAREVEGLDYAAIGTRYALSEASVRSLLHRARKTLRREYAARGGTLPAGGLVVLAPWLHPLRALTRLRDSARRLAGPAASVAVIAAAGLVPALSQHARAPQPVPAVRLPLAAAEAPAAQPATTAATSPAAAPAAATPTQPSAAGPMIGLPVKLESVHACSSVSATVVGVNCLSTQDQPRIYVGPSLPGNPTGVQGLAIEHSSLNCQLVPATLLTKCTQDGSAPASQQGILPVLSTRGESR